MPGKLILVVAPSGSGKSALMAHLREVMPELIFPVSCTTRSPRAGEVSGQTYYFVSNEEFDVKIAAGEFLEWANYGGNRYGTLRSEIVPALEAGKTVVREIEIQGVRRMRQVIPEDALRIIFIDAGSWDDLARRIQARAAITLEELARRKERYEDERTIMSDAFAVVANPDGALEQAKKDFITAIQDAIAS